MTRYMYTSASSRGHYCSHLAAKQAYLMENNRNICTGTHDFVKNMEKITSSDILLKYLRVSHYRQHPDVLWVFITTCHHHHHSRLFFVIFSLKSNFSCRWGSEWTRLYACMQCIRGNLKRRRLIIVHLFLNNSHFLT